MKEQKYHIYLTNQERSEIIESLIDFKNLALNPVPLFRFRKGGFFVFRGSRKKIFNFF